jgi:hypothetical protein
MPIAGKTGSTTSSDRETIVTRLSDSGAHMESGMTLGFQGAPGPVTAAKVAACARGPLQWLSKEALEGDGLQNQGDPTPSA